MKPKLRNAMLAKIHQMAVNLITELSSINRSDYPKTLKTTVSFNLQ